MTGIKRRREPEIGDHWGGCNDARAAGTVPIHRGEPGYDAKMDGDDDGIACEPSPGA
ncbi:MAG: excalibur calcium-binding domain-containing protein [Sphingomonas sanguinis]|nr:excalibur calcium-binding domain-containing protein [Sphingomonas sanguinis]MBZ6381407.1 excalibur calcium-binding domain-containing protein [Sphingomonas sanguinis]HJO67056.1 excalibur calcium-binding domain-containing protein [Sphingomonas sanguinis]